MKIILKSLLNTLDAIADEHGEVSDTDVREQMYAAVYHGFIAQTPGYELPPKFGMFESAGDTAVHAALAAFLPAARSAGLETPQQRFDAFQDGTVFSDVGNPYDEYFGHANSLAQLAAANDKTRNAS